MEEWECIGGIDPGKKGGLAVLCSGKIQSVHRVPIVKAKGVKDKPNYPMMFDDWSVALKQCTHVFIELVGSMPKQGVASSFNFGYVAGFAYGLVTAYRIPHTFITPQKWKKACGISGNDGAISIKRACQLFPDAVKEFRRVTVDEGVAEASLIAYGGNLIREAA